MHCCFRRKFPSNIDFKVCLTSFGTDVQDLGCNFILSYANGLTRIHTPTKFSFKRTRFQLRSVLTFCFMPPNLWFKTPINAIQGLTTCPVRNGLHIGRADILSKKLLQKRYFDNFATQRKADCINSRKISNVDPRPQSNKVPLLNSTSTSVMIVHCSTSTSCQKWKNVQTVQTRLCYFFSLAVLIFWLCTCKLDKTLC